MAGSRKIETKYTQNTVILKKEHFSQNGLTGLFCNQYNCSVKKAINETFSSNEGLWIL